MNRAWETPHLCLATVRVCFEAPVSVRGRARSLNPRTDLRRAGAGPHGGGEGPLEPFSRPTGAAPGRDLIPKGGGGYPPPPLQTPKWLYRTMGFVGAGDFVLGTRQGDIFLFDPMCLYSKYSEFCGEFKNG